MTLDFLRRFGERRLDRAGLIFDLRRQAQQPLALCHRFADERIGTVLRFRRRLGYERLRARARIME